MKPTFYKDKVVVITGGSSGIGLALAKEFVMQQAQVVLIARGEEKLQTVSSLPLPCVQFRSEAGSVSFRNN